MQTEVPTVVAEANADPVVERAIMHFLDPSKVEKKLVRREIQFKGTNANVVRSFLCRLIKVALESSETCAEAHKDGSDTLASCWRIIDDPDSFVDESVFLAERLNAVMESKGRGRANISSGDRSRSGRLAQQCSIEA